jgi:trehalose/maltose hydrolase-like predicted phosphorylase
MLVRSFLGLHPDVPRKRISLSPNLPPQWGALSLEGLTLAGQRVRVSAAGRRVQTVEAPAGWTVEPAGA